MGALAKLWGVWRHGATLAVVYGLCLALLMVVAYVAAWALNGALELVPEHRLFNLVLILAPVWVPLGLGMGARYSSSDKLKPEGYLEHA